MQPLSTPSKPGRSSDVGRDRTQDDTPRIARSGGDHKAQTDNREDVAREMDQEVLQVSLQLFQATYLPFTPNDQEMTNCVRRLVKEEVLQTAGDEYWWGKKGFQWEANKGLSENEIYGQLVDIAKTIAHERFLAESEGRCMKSNIEYSRCPDNFLRSDLEGSNFKIDGCFRLAKRSDCWGGVPYLITHDVAVAAEFKKSKNDRGDNAKQLVSAASHIMNDDPRRIFMFGITIEEQEMSLWYFSRSHSAKSQTFNILKDPLSLISAFLSFLFGKETKLGYDSNVSRCTVQGKVCWEYRVGSDWYRTCGALSSYRALGISGRMTRVWKAQKIDNRGGNVCSDCMALKDVWLDRDAETERNIQKRLFEKLDAERAAYDGGQRGRFRDVTNACEEKYRAQVLALLSERHHTGFFMTIEDDYIGATTKAKPIGAIPARGLFLPRNKGSVSSRSHHMAGSDPSRSIGTPYHSSPHTSGMYSPNPGDREYRSRKRYIVVYDKVGDTLHRIRSATTTFSALRDVVIALMLMFVAGWIHRDVSSGNILVVDGRGLLSDLEYAKEIDSKSPSSLEPKTGTPFFMAIELLTQISIADRQTPEDSQQKFARDAYGDFDTEYQTSQASGLNPWPKQNIKHSPFHDQESIWWIFLWFLLARLRCKKSIAFAQKIFVNRLTSTSERTDFFLTGKYPSKELPSEELPSKELPPGKPLPIPFPNKNIPEHIPQALEKPRRALNQAYIQVERALGKVDFEEIYNNTYMALGYSIARTLFICSERGGDMEFVPFPASPDDATVDPSSNSSTNQHNKVKRPLVSYSDDTVPNKRHHGDIEPSQALVKPRLQPGRRRHKG